MLSALPAAFSELDRVLGLTPGGPGFIFNDSASIVSDASEAGKNEACDANGRVVFFLRSYIDAHLTEDISLVKLSEVSGYNASYLSRFFKKVAGETLNSYISRKRLKLVQDLMLDPTLNFCDISRRAGFNSRTYFNRFIRRTTGRSPQQMRDGILSQNLKETRENPGIEG
jgi:AraC-like DNA-binding protein